MDLSIADDLWIKKWIKTFFSSIFDLSITIRVWDCVIGVGLRFLVNYCLAIFDYYKERILQLKKVKYFLEFFDYDLKKRYIKVEEIINFREEIIKLAQSYNIPDGKYQLIEKEYLSYLFNDKKSLKSQHFDSSKTINNYYTNNESLNEEQYHIKLILRTIIYIPSEYLKNNVEDKAIYKFKKKKTNKWLDVEKSLNKIDELDKDSEISILDKKKIPKKSIKIGDMNIYSVKNSSNIGSEDDDEEKNSESITLNSNPIDKLKGKLIDKDNTNNKEESNENEIIKINKNSLNNNNLLESNQIIDSSKSEEDIYEEKEENKEEFSDNDIATGLSFHEEQMPDSFKE